MEQETRSTDSFSYKKKPAAQLNFPQSQNLDSMAIDRQNEEKKQINVFEWFTSVTKVLFLISLFEHSFVDRHCDSGKKSLKLAFCRRSSTNICA